MARVMTPRVLGCVLLALRCGLTASFVPPVGGGLRAIAVTPQQPRLARPPSYDSYRPALIPSARRAPPAKLNIAGTLISPVTFLMAIALNLFGGFLKLAWRLVFLSFVIRIITIFPPAGFLVATVLNKGLGIVSTLTGGISTASRFAASAAGAWRNKLARQLGREPTITTGGGLGDLLGGMGGGGGGGGLEGMFGDMASAMPTGPPPAPFVPNVDNDGVSVKVRKKGVDLSNGGAVDVSAATATSDVLSAAAAADSASDVASIREAVSSMRVKEITTELASLGVDKGDAIQKEDLVEKLVQARMGGGVAAAPPVETAPDTAPTKSALGDAFAKAPKKEKKKKKKGMFGGGGGGKGAGANPFAGGANPFTGPDPFGFGSPFGADPMAGFDGFADNLGVDPQEAMEQAAKMMDDPDGKRCCFARRPCASLHHVLMP